MRALLYLLGLIIFMTSQCLAFPATTKEEKSDTELDLRIVGVDQRNEATLSVDPHKDVAMVKDLVNDKCYFFYKRVLAKLNIDLSNFPPADYTVILKRNVDKSSEAEPYLVRIFDPVTTNLCDGGATYWLASDDFIEPAKRHVLSKPNLPGTVNANKREIISCVGDTVQVCSVENDAKRGEYSGSFGADNEDKFEVRNEIRNFFDEFLTKNLLG